MAQALEARESHRTAGHRGHSHLSLTTWLMPLRKDQVHFLPESHWCRIHPWMRLAKTLKTSWTRYRDELVQTWAVQ